MDSHITKVQKLWSTINSTLQSERQAASPLERSYCEAHYYKTKGGNLQKELRVCVQHLHSLESKACEQRLYSIPQKIKDVLDMVEQQPTSPAIESHSHRTHAFAIDEEDHVMQRFHGNGDGVTGDFSVDCELCFSIDQDLNARVNSYNLIS